MKKCLAILFLLLSCQVVLPQDDDKNNCEIIFSYNILDNQLSYFSHKVVSGGDRIVSYLWDFGDGYTSQLANPEHVFLHEGEYVTCLTVVFENNCTATYCDTIEVENPLLEPSQNYGISGSVYAGNALLPEGIVILFKRVGSTYRAISYTKVCQGFYSFSNLAPSQYWLYAIPYFNVNTLFYPNYFPTYYGNKLLWQDAIPITVTGMHMGKNIHLLMSSELFIGSDSLYGKMYISDSTYFEYNVYLNNWFSNTLPPQEHLNLAPNQVILLADGQSKVQRFALTNHYGEFVFKNIPRQIIKLRPEKFGVAAQTFTVDLNQQQYIEFILNPGSIVIQVENNELQSERLRVFPNPTSSYVFVELDKILLEKEVIIELTSMQGISVYKECIRYNQGESLLLPLSELAAGVYILSVRNNNYFERCFIIKQ